MPTRIEIFWQYHCRPKQCLRLDGRVWNNNSWWKSSAPYRNVTAREAISDLPRIHNGSSIEVMNYRSAPESHIQKLMRWSEAEGSYSSQVFDHICKKMTPLMQARISLIPTRPGADWRDLPNIVWKFADGTKTGKQLLTLTLTLPYPKKQRRLCLVWLNSFSEKLVYNYNDYTAHDISRFTGVCACQVGPKIRCRKKEENQKNSIIPWAKVIFNFSFKLPYSSYKT